jgi:hypothetical protein
LASKKQGSATELAWGDYSVRGKTIKIKRSSFMNVNFKFFRVMAALCIVVVAVFGQEQKLTLDETVADNKGNRNFYGSIKYSSVIPRSFAGFDVELGGLFEKFFFSLDYAFVEGFTYTKETITSDSTTFRRVGFFHVWAASFGGRIQPTKNFQVIAGGSVGLGVNYDYGIITYSPSDQWTKSVYSTSTDGGTVVVTEEVDNYGYKRYNVDVIHNSSNQMIVRGFCGGPFVKLLLGKKYVWFETYSRTLIIGGRNDLSGKKIGVCEQIGAGITFTPVKKSRR